uniref:Putative neurotoxin LTDF 08-01 n=1 Tax=Dolomedes fimbriatus TaxID=1432569 RepID=A0A0K1D8C7_9ARAC|nr:putative neurotoxin LTDF 08-01 [Dolomedes fimbriatus]
MRLHMYVFVFAVFLTVLLGVHAEPDSSDKSEPALEGRGLCIRPNMPCGRSVPCCSNESYNRPCICSLIGTNCTCRKTASEILGGWFSK